MKKSILRIPSILIALSLTLVIMLTGCGQKDNVKSDESSSQTPIVKSVITSSDNDDSLSSDANDNDSPSASNNIASSNPENVDSGVNSTATSKASSELYVRFGDDGAPFTMHLYDNDTAAAIAKHIGTADWRLPIYHYDDYEGWEAMQYYDIPSRYDIPSNPTSVTSEKAGAVYYSSPNRIVLFFGDAQITGDYTQVGYFDVSEEFVSAVANNPALEGWGNKIIQISAKE